MTQNKGVVGVNRISTEGWSWRSLGEAIANAPTGAEARVGGLTGGPWPIKLNFQ